MSVIRAFAATGRECKAVQGTVAVKQMSPGTVEMSAGPNSVLVFKTGMGPACARSGAVRELESGRSGMAAPSAVIVFGLAGGLSPSLEEGQVVLYTTCLATEKGSAPLKCSRALNQEIASTLAAGGITFQTVSGISSPRMAVTFREKEELAASGAGVVDMESYGIVEASTSLGIPAAVVRTVSDRVDRQLPDFNPALRADGEFSPLRLALICLSHPLGTAALAASSRRALKALGNAAGVILGGLRLAESPADIRQVRAGNP